MLPGVLCHLYLVAPATTTGGADLLNMRAAIALTTVVLLADGCAGRVNEVMKSWVGHHYSDLIAAWGPPAQVLDDGSGGKIMTWASTRSPLCQYE